MTSSTLNVINETEYENDPFASVPDDIFNGTYPKTIKISSYYLIISIIKLILVLAVIVANTFLVIVILRFKRLKSIRTNIYILNLSVLNIIYCFCAPLFYTICHLFSAHEETSVVILQTQSTLLTLYSTFAFTMGMDWFLTGSKIHMMNTFDKYYKFVFVAIYVIFFVEWIAAFIYSEVEHIARAATFIIFYIIYIVILTIVNVLKGRINLRSESKKTEYSFVISNIIIHSFLPIFFFHFMYELSSPNVYSVLLVLEIIPETIQICHPILVVFMLGKLNKHFKMAYIKAFKRSVQSYEDDDLDISSVEQITTPEVPQEVIEI